MEDTMAITAHPPLKGDDDSVRCRFVMAVNDKPFKTVNIFHCRPSEVRTIKTYMAMTARAFRKTAGILVYREVCDTDTQQPVWALLDTCEISTKCQFPARFASDDELYT